MSNKNIYEVFDDFRIAKTKKDRIDILRRNDTYALRQVILGTFHPSVKFTIKDIPEWKRDLNLPAGMAYGNMTEALSRIYLFMEGNPRVPAGLSDKRKKEILIQILESLEPKEADVFIGIIKKDQKIPYLTEALINEAFEGLLPQS